MPKRALSRKGTRSSEDEARLEESLRSIVVQGLKRSRAEALKSAEPLLVPGGIPWPSKAGDSVPWDDLGDWRKNASAVELERCDRLSQFCRSMDLAVDLVNRGSYLRALVFLSSWLAPRARGHGRVSAYTDRELQVFAELEWSRDASLSRSEVGRRLARFVALSPERIARRIKHPEP
jgi:hypothetical protein